MTRRSEKEEVELDESIASALYEDAIANGEPWALEDAPELWNPLYTCPACRGSGLESLPVDRSTSGGHEQAPPCQDCGGTGEC